MLSINILGSTVWELTTNIQSVIFLLNSRMLGIFIWKCHSQTKLNVISNFYYKLKWFIFTIETHLKSTQFKKETCFSSTKKPLVEHDYTSSIQITSMVQRNFLPKMVIIGSFSSIEWGTNHGPITVHQASASSNNSFRSTI